MFWTAVSTSFRLLALCKNLCSLLGVYDHRAHLSFSDVTLDTKHSTTVAQVTIMASKTNPFHHCFTPFLGWVHNKLCPVTALAAYLASRGDSPGPLFKLSTGCPLSREAFVSVVHRALSVAGFNATWHAGHSFRSGAATTAVACGFKDSLIKTLRRRKSAAYQWHMYMYFKSRPLCLVGSLVPLNYMHVSS